MFTNIINNVLYGAVVHVMIMIPYIDFRESHELYLMANAMDGIGITQA